MIAALPQKIAVSDTKAEVFSSPGRYFSLALGIMVSNWQAEINSLGTANCLLGNKKTSH
jgi:hypothetical protein